MLDLSVVIITRNEEKNIGRCLKSVSGMASEIIVVDSHSTDKTTEICKQYDATVMVRDFKGFGDQKQYATEQASHEWVLSLDADEQLSEELKRAIEKELQNPQSDVYSFNRLTNYCGQWIRHGGWYPDKKIRLYKKASAQWNEFPVHELLVVKKGAKRGHLNGDLLHYSIESMEYHINQINKYSTIAAQNIIDKNRRINAFHLCIKPIARFIKIYFLKAGLLDGYYGFVIARNSAFAVYLRFAKAKAIKRKNRK